MFSPTFKPANIAPKGDEIAEVVDIMESEFKDAKSMARKIISTVFARFAKRTWYSIAQANEGGFPLFFGLFATDKAAMKAIEKGSLGVDGPLVVIEIAGVGAHQEKLLAYEDELRRPCSECGHDEAPHDWPRAKRRGCIVGGCGCPQYLRPDYPYDLIEVA